MARGTLAITNISCDVDLGVLLTDMTGVFYTIVLELTLPNLATLETMMPKIMGDKDWQANYQKLLPLVESGQREIFTLVE